MLPDIVGNTTALFLTFANNNFTGPIPSSIGKAKNLLEVLFLNNQLSGCLPHEIGYLNKATVFDAGFNRLTGPIPFSFGCLMKIEILNFTVNELYGAVPKIVCKLPNIAKELHFRRPDQRPGTKCAAFFSKRKYCPNEKLMKWIPCKKELSWNRMGTSSEQKKSSGPASVGFTYGTLVAHGPLFNDGAIAKCFSSGSNGAGCDIFCVSVLVGRPGCSRYGGRLRPACAGFIDPAFCCSPLTGTCLCFHRRLSLLSPTPVTFHVPPVLQLAFTASSQLTLHIHSFSHLSTVFGESLHVEGASGGIDLESIGEENDENYDVENDFCERDAWFNEDPPNLRRNE
ncbi:hypothetical protein SLEP1_g14169 [Rubroshorea leprosula]|uniref:Uncharacterized protein n=1 Tax=Rubroshorea leprosula TaxID=152421 RepID=A0AAV5IP01_9ROSI|nr:hypothetical protein SLEP1_g14169 [Rubroshorea leprosula]